MSRLFLISSVVLVGLMLAGCSEAISSRIDSRTFAIEGPSLPSESDGPNRRAALRMCPKGYRVLDEVTRRNTRDGYNNESGTFTNWKIRCL